MLSLKECRKILGPSCSLTDSDIEQLREGLHALADIALEVYPKLQTPNTTPPLTTKQTITFEDMFKLLSETEKDEVIERVSIIEFDGKFTRKEAEEITMSKYLKNYSHGN